MLLGLVVIGMFVFFIIDRVCECIENTKEKKK